MQTARQNFADGTIKLTLTIPQKRVAEVREKEIQKAISQVEIKGFRKGKAPRPLAEEKISKERLLEQVANLLIPQIYHEVTQKENIKPIINPQIKLLSSEPDKDWQIEVQTCEAPKINLRDYKEEVKKINATGKIWTPTRAKQNRGRTQSINENAQDNQERLSKILAKLIEVVNPQIANVLIEQELSRRLAALIDKTEKLGISLEQYLASTGQTIENLKKTYRRSSQEYWQLEFILNQIADEEKLSVIEDEIRNFVNQAKEKGEKEVLQGQQYFVANLLRRQKTLDFLLKL